MGDDGLAMFNVGLYLLCEVGMLRCIGGIEREECVGRIANGTLEDGCEKLELELIFGLFLFAYGFGEMGNSIAEMDVGVGIVA